MRPGRVTALLLSFLCAFASWREDSSAASTHDIIIYGGTSAAVTAAVQAKRLGKSVVIVSPDQHLGGLSSGGLGWTDTGNKAVIGGLAHEFYHRVYQHYRNEEAWKWQQAEDYGGRAQGHRAADDEKRTMWVFEPHVAENIFDDFVTEYDIPVHHNEWLNRESGVAMDGPRITAITTLSGKTFSGKIFIDATYEGDLMAAAGVDYHVGREATDVYDEEWNGIQTGVLHHNHHFDTLDNPVDPYHLPGDPQSGVLPRISPDPPGEFGKGDHRVQAYCFRMCLTDHPGNLVPFTKPDGYDPKQYELMARIFDAGWRMQVFKKFDPLPNRKTDTNNHGPFSTDNIGFNYDYPEASYERRQEIIDEHEQYQKGWLYFIATDPRVPAEVQEEMNRWGLPKDEFIENDHWSPQLYIREARRMIGEFVMTENELLKKRPTPDPIGMGSYTMDSHNVQRYITPEGHVQNEGDIGVGTKGPYQIAYGALVPKKAQCDNLFVPVCVSSSHIAFGSIRMEPVFMILGESAATAAALAIDDQLAVQDVPYEKLQSRLLKDGQILKTPESALSTGGLSKENLEGLVFDESQAAKKTGSWSSSHANKPFYGSGYLHDGNSADGQSTLTFNITLDQPGRYRIKLLYPPNKNRATNTPVTIRTLSGNATVTNTINQQEPSAWLLDTPFDLPAQFTVTVSNKDTDGYVVVDALQLVPAK